MAVQKEQVNNVEVIIEDQIEEEFLPDIVIDNAFDELEKVIDLDVSENDGELLIDLTSDAKGRNEDNPLEVIEDDDIIITEDSSGAGFNTVSDRQLSTELHCQINDLDDQIPDRTYWESLLGALERCSTDLELEQFVKGINVKLLPRKNMNIPFRVGLDCIDHVAMDCIPDDAPKNVVAVRITGDGNCLCRAISWALFGTDAYHLQIRAMIVIEGIRNKALYMKHSVMSHGSNNV